jgi:thiosulfate dehydrogenase (quinone) large subunit
MTAEPQPHHEDATLPDPRLLAKGLAALRIFVGVVFLANGLAKLFQFRNVEVGPYRSFLINRDEARSILEGEAGRSDVPGIPGLVENVLLPNYEWLQWLLTFVELGVGALLIIGLASRGAALVGLGQQLFLAVLYASSGRWMFEQPHEYVPLFILLLVPAGRVWGLDHRLVHRGIRRLRGFPF